MFVILAAVAGVLTFLFCDAFVVAALWLTCKFNAYRGKGIDSNAEEVLCMRLWGTRMVCGLRTDAREELFGRYFLSFPVWNLYLWTRINSYFYWQKRGVQWILLMVDQFFGGVLSFILWRVKVFESVLTDELAVGCQQIVMLGAGWDSRAYRFAKEREATNAVVFEVDMPEVQKAKCGRLHELTKSGQLAPSQITGVRFVSCDLNVDNLTDALMAYGFQPQLKTLVLWEGVTWYLSESAVRTTLRRLKAAVYPGVPLKLVFDYCPARQLCKKTQSSGHRRLQVMSEKKGMGFTYGMDPEGVRPLIESEDYVQLEEWTSKRAAVNYMPEGFRHDYDFGRIVICELRC